jgi:RNA-directed DNA polymerase
MEARRQNQRDGKGQGQLELPFVAGAWGEASCGPAARVEASMSANQHESPTNPGGVMQEVLQPENLQKALEKVCANKGSPGADGMTVGALPGYLREHWPGLRQQLLAGTYKPQPVKRVEIPKPDGGVRKLGIPTVLDRFIQQAVLQVLGQRWDGTFSSSSFVFRPGKCAHQAVARAQEHITAGRVWVVDIDLEKFFDRVNHDRLMGRIMKRETDKTLCKLIRSYLTAGVLEGGLVSPTQEGTPQGGPLSPLLSNLVLDELDKELEHRGHAFVRYADDCNIYVCSEAAGHRVMESVSGFIGRVLKLKVNTSKSAVAKPGQRKFLGFSFTGGREPRRRIAPKALARFKKRIKELTRRKIGRSFVQLLPPVQSYLRGWRGYFGYCQTPSVLESLDSWLRRRLRSLAWTQWKTCRRRRLELQRRGVYGDLAAQTAGSRHGPWRISKSPALSVALPNALWDRLGVLRLKPS